MGSEQDRTRELVLRMYDEVWNKGNLAAADDTVDPGVDDTVTDRVTNVPGKSRGALEPAGDAAVAS